MLNYIEGGNIILRKGVLTFGITILFVLSAVSPIVFGYKISISEETEPQSTSSGDGTCYTFKGFEFTSLEDTFFNVGDEQFIWNLKDLSDSSTSDDPWMLEGWPVVIDTTNAITASPISYDFNNDGKQELIISTFGPPGSQYDEGRIYVLNSDGTIAPGWPFITFACASATPAIADLNNDGNPEIIATCWNIIYVLHFDGSLIWQRYVDRHYNGGPTLADIDQDNCPEIILTAGGIIFAFDHDGTDVDGWPVIIEDSEWPSRPAVADLDEDGYIEIVVNFHPTGEITETYVFSHDGNIEDGWPQVIPRGCLGPVIGDIDGDSHLEIVRYGKNKIYVYEANGSIASGWPRDVQGTNTQELCLGDIDGDSLPEILFCKYHDSKSYLYAFNGDGSYVDGWPIIGPEGINAFESSVSIADIDADSVQEIIVKGNCGEKIYIFNPDGSNQEGWPRDLDDCNHFIIGKVACPLVTDLTGDGTVEIIAVSNFNTVYVWNLSSIYDQRYMDWPMFNHDIYHTGCYVSWSANVPPSKPNTPSGEKNGIPGVEYEYLTKTSDIDNDQIFYLFDWGDGSNTNWFGPYNSGQEVSAKHIWPVKGEYEIKVTTKDINGAQSQWSDSFLVTMPRSKTLQNTMLRYLDGFSLLEKMLLYLIK